jgi:CubicO group peptidase (beta-lactamase class C family)
MKIFFVRYWAILSCLALLALLPAAVADDSSKEKKSVAASLKPFVEKQTLAGAVVLVADKDKTLALEAVGYADVENKKPLKTDALFWIASQSKPITAAALMILVDDGKLSLDDPVEKHLPEFKEIKYKGEKPKTTITIRHLLSHTSGLPFRSAQEKPTLDVLTLKDAVSSYAKTPLNSEPGTKYEYSNAGINAAGRIIEVVSGTAYETFLDKRLLGPLGMKDTTFWPSEEQLKRLATSYKPNKNKDGLEATTIGQLKYPLSDRKRQPMPAGGLFSTASDVGRFCQMMLNEGKYDGKQILSKSAVKELTKKQTPEAVKVNYGLGFSTGGDNFGHGGAFATNMNVDVKRGLVTVFLVQHAGFHGDGGKALGAFRKAADDLFAPKK